MSIAAIYILCILIFQLHLDLVQTGIMHGGGDNYKEVFWI